MCGGDLELTEGSTTCECEYCGTNQTVPSADNEKKMNLFNRANRLRFASEFDKATGVYESIVSEFPEEAEAYWGLCLCKYGIEYVDDPSTGKKIPTCHRTSFESIFNDSNFEMALEYSDLVAQRVYREEAKEIDRLQKAILDIAKSESPYDVFICYKETASDGQRTKDSVMAQDIYDALTDKGYKVFFARITLEDKLGQEYEPYIFSALTSAKVMLAIGTDYEYFNAVWVKNEWSRFLDMMKSDKSKTLIPCYADIDAYDMPQEFKNLQGQDMGKVGFIQDLVRGIGKIIPKGEAAVSAPAAPVQTVVQQVVSGANVESLLKRAFMFLKDEDWDKADEYFEKVLDTDPECVEAYLGKLMVEYECTSKEELENCDTSFAYNKHYLKIVDFGDETLKSELSSYIEQINSREEMIEISEENILTMEDITDNEITEFYIPENIIRIDSEAFDCCYDLQNIYVEKKNNHFKSVDGVLFNRDCTVIIRHPQKKRKKFKFPNSVIRVEDNAFDGCEFLTNIIIPKSVTSIGKYAFSQCESLTSISVDDQNAYYKSIDGVLFTNDTSRIIKYPPKKTNDTYTYIIPDGVTSIGDDAFSFCNSLTNITIPEGVTSIGDDAFSFCNSLTNITIPEGVTSIGDDAFSFCSFLINITIPESVTSIGDNAFYDCSSLIEISIPEGVTSIGKCAFDCCTSIKNIMIPESVTSIGNSAFSGCTSLTNITIPEKFIDQIKKDCPKADICTHEQRKRQQEQERQLLERQQEQERQLLERQKEKERQELEHQKRLLEDQKKSLTEEYDMNIQRLSELENEKNAVAAELAEIKGIFSGSKRKKTQERLTEIENRIAKLNSRNPEIEQELRKIDAKLSKLEPEKAGTDDTNKKSAPGGICDELQRKLPSVQITFTELGEVMDAEFTNNGNRFRVRWNKANPRFAITKYYDGTYKMSFCKTVDEVIQIIL